MSNFLDNGTVLPSGLLGTSEQSAIEGFNKTYCNTPLRMGIIVNSYSVNNPNNFLKLTTEYDVLVFEQLEDRGYTINTYPHCIAGEGMGSIADFFEKNLRVKQNMPNNTPLVNTANQNGAVVLILCLDGVSDKAIIIGAVTHPDRPTTLISEKPYLEGEYNGINVKIKNDGSTYFTFNGATDNEGNAIDPTQGTTTAQIETDGSFQIQHSTITFRLDRNGTATVTTSSDLDLNVSGDVNMNVSGNVSANCTDLSVTALGAALIEAVGTATVDGALIKLGAAATQSVILGDIFMAYFNTHIHPTVLGPSGPPVVPMPQESLSIKVITE